MKRIALYLTITHLAFTCGVAVSSFWNGSKGKPVNAQIRRNGAKLPSIDVNRDPLPPVSTITPAPHREVVFGDGRLRLVTHQVRMESERLHYKVDVSYPEIVGTKDSHIQNLNREIEKLVAHEYQSIVNPSEAELRRYKETFPSGFNSIDLNYEVRLATNSVLSIYFCGYEYNIGAAHSAQYSFTVNYDLTQRKKLELSDIFKPKSKYLEFIARHCTEELVSRFVYFSEELSPRTKNFESWNITSSGIRFNFDACTIAACGEGEQEVEIPFTELKPWLNSRTLRQMMH